MRKSTFTLLVLLVLISSTLFAGTTGKIVGKVKDVKSGEALPYATIVIEGTQIGAQSDARGKFIIMNVDPGRYSVVCQLMGYQAVKTEDVVVAIDETTTLNFRLESTSTAIEGMKVTKKQEQKINKTNTGSVQKISAETIEDVAVGDIEGLVAMKAGAHQSADGELHVRGGQGNEVKYTIDGMSVSDPVDGGSALSVDTDAVASMNVITGGLPAEYGNAQSGMVNVVTKSGSKDYHGKVEVNTDHLFADSQNSDEFKFNLGGPLLGYGFGDLREDLTFFLNGGAKWADGKYREYYESDAASELQYLSDPELQNKYDPYESRDSFAMFDLGNRNYNTYSINLKTQYKLNPFTKFTFAVRGSRDFGQPYSHSWKYSLANYYEYENNMRQYIFTYDQIFGQAFNLKIKGSFFSKESTQNPVGLEFDDFFYAESSFQDSLIIANVLANEAVEITELQGIGGLDIAYDGRLDNAYVPWEYAVQGQIEGKSVSDLGFIAPGTYSTTFVDDKTETISLRADATYQYNEIHEMKSGVEFIKHSITKDQISGPAAIDYQKYYKYLENPENATPIVGAGEDDVLGTDDDINYYRQADRLKAIKNSVGLTDGYEADPIQAAFYFQDKMEWEGMIVNAGIRFDFWYLGKDYTVKDEDGSYNTQEFDSDDRLKLNVSPRLGISHPISERDVLRFSYNYQNQLPSMKYIFTTKTPEDALTSSGVQVGNPNLDPQLTITYEVGLQHQISDLYVLDVAAYYKNTYNYISQQEYNHPDSPAATYTQFISQDYGSSQGIDLNLSRALSDFIAGSVSYSLAWANGNFQSTNSVVSEADEDLREYPLGWDTRHSFNLNAEFRVQDEEVWLVPFIDYEFPVDDFAVNVLYHINSGTPYTPINDDDQELERNSELMDVNTTTDVKIVKNFKIGGEGSPMKMKVYFEISNIFDRENQNYVYAKTGNTYDDGNDNPHEDSQTHVTNPESTYIRNLFLNDPAMVSSGRTMVFGVSYKW